MPASILPSRAASAREQATAATWQERMRRDARTAAALKPELKALTGEVLSRAVDSGALGVAVTGSTAVDRRTRASDLDFYVVGAKPTLPISDEELDVFALPLDDFKQRLEYGDDYLHWTLRFGLILHDSGPFQWAAERTAREDLWPDPATKAIQARRALEMAAAILLTRDHHAAVEQSRVALSLAARWWLLKSGRFPRARSDLPDQLSGTALGWLGELLGRTIFEDPSDAELAGGIERLRLVLSEVQSVPAATPSRG
jgi:hypothetical protein